MPSGDDQRGLMADADAMAGNLPGQAEEKPQFQSKAKLILTCLGCAVGTGNIWRFPRMAANNSQNKGGLVFLIVWTLFLFLWSIPMLVIEYGVGRFTQKGVLGSFRTFISDRASFLGAWIVMVSFFISCFYSVILGWCLYYTGYCAFIGLPDTPEESKAIFDDFAVESDWPVLSSFAAILLAGVSVAKGVRTIELVSIVLVPALLVIIVFSFVASLTLDNAMVGVNYLFTPHWESFSDIQLWIDALSQNAFDTGAGAGLFVSYASYMSARHGIVKYATAIPALNNIISLLCGVTIFAGVFGTMITSYGFMSKQDIIDVIMDSGPGSTGLTFIWLPVLFSTLDTVGRVVAVLFFLCLSFAGLTSLISNMELFTLTLTDFGLPRGIAMPTCIVFLFLFSLMSSLNIHILNNQDFVWGFGLVVNGLMFVVLVLFYGATRFRDEVINHFGFDDWQLPKIWVWMVRVVLPLEGLGLILGWALDLIINSDQTEGNWNELGERTFATTILEWGGLFLIILTITMVYVYCWQRRNRSEEEYPPVLREASGSVRSYDSGTSTNHNRSAAYASITEF